MKPLPKPFPLTPLGQMLVVRVCEQKTVLAMPEEMVKDEHVVAEVIASGTGNPTITGAILENRCKVGDLVILQTMALMRITRSVRPYLVDRGVDEEAFKNLAIAQEDHVVAILPPLDDAKVVPEPSVN